MLPCLSSACGQKHGQLRGRPHVSASMLRTTSVATSTTRSSRALPPAGSGSPLPPGTHPVRPHASQCEAAGLPAPVIEAQPVLVTEAARGEVLLPSPGPDSRGGAFSPPSDGLCSVSTDSRSSKHHRAMHTCYLPKLGGEFEQFSFLSSRVSRRQKVRLQGRPGTGEMTGGEKKRRLYTQITKERRGSVTAVSNELALRNSLVSTRHRRTDPTSALKNSTRACPGPLLPGALTKLEPGEIEYSQRSPTGSLGRQHATSLPAGRPGPGRPDCLLGSVLPLPT